MGDNWLVSKQLIPLLLKWYEENKRDLPWRHTPHPYQVWISEIMLQQTRVEAVKTYFERFLQRLPTVKDLAFVDEEELLKLWEGLGYYNRARNLKKAAQQIVAEFHGEFPSSYAELLKLKGIGPYTAAAIASICFGEQTPAIDGNVLRVVSRLCASPQDVELPQTRNAVFSSLQSVMPKENTASFTQAWMELGATVCLPNGAPRCNKCPLSQFCKAHKESRELDFPVKGAKANRKIEKMTVFVLECEGHRAILKRPSHGLLAGLWEFPHVNGWLQINEAIAMVDAWGAQPFELIKTSEKKHIFTHKEWHMFGVYLKCKKMPKQFVWASDSQRKEAFALPTAFRQFEEYN